MTKQNQGLNNQAEYNEQELRKIADDILRCFRTWEAAGISEETMLGMGHAIFVHSIRGSFPKEYAEKMLRDAIR